MSNSEHQPSSPFRGFRSPNYTPVPDELFDELLVELSGAELKALLYIVRRTFGFKRDRDNISLSQMLQGIQTRDGRVLDRGVGLSKKTLLLALRSLEDRGIILTERRQSAEKGNEPTAYCLNVVGSTPDGPALGEESTPPLGEKLRQGGGGESTPSPWGKNYAVQETVEQQSVNSTGFDRFAIMQQDGETSKFSKKSSNVAKTHVVASADSTAAQHGPTAVGEIIARRRGTRPSATAPAHTEPPAGVLGDAPSGPKRAPKSVARPATPPESQPAPPGAAEGPKRGRPPQLSPYLEDLIDRYSAEL